MNVIQRATLLIAVVSLLACGGGGGGGGGGTAGDAAAGVPNTEANVSSAALAAPTVIVNAADPALSNNVINTSGAFDPAAYRTTADVLGKEAGLAYRYGPGPEAYGTTGNAGLPTYFKHGDTPFLSDRQGGGRPCIVGICGTYQFGNFTTDSGDYFSNFGHAAFLPDSPSTHVGVSGLHISSASNNVFSQKPELSWTLYGEGVDESNFKTYRTEGKDPSNPIAVGRCHGRPGWCMSSVAAFQNGLIAVVGSNTAHNKATVQLASGKVPTAVALSNSGEFAFITVWDKTNLRGEIAVVALASLCDSCTQSSPNKGDYWGEWGELNPGLPNLSNIVYMKVLGYVPLPADMKAPTEISVTTGVSRNVYLSEGKPSSYAVPLTNNEGNRNLFKAGGAYADSYAKSGVAVVISKSEQKVAFVDLKPLFQYYQRMYFGTTGDFGVTRTVGPADNQWPRTFGAAPEQTPTVIKTMSVGSRPTAVKAYLWGTNKRAWVATQDGKLRVFNLGDFPTAGNGAASSIAEVGSVDVGRNPTGIAYVKEKANFSSRIYPDLNNEVIVTSRGDRKIQWVRFSGNGGEVVRTLQDQRLVDPVAAEDTDNHGTESYVLSVADFGGKKLHNFRYGPVIMWTKNTACQPPNGCGVSGGGAFEYGGAFDLPGKVFQVASANVP